MAGILRPMLSVLEGWGSEDWLRSAEFPKGQRPWRTGSVETRRPGEEDDSCRSLVQESVAE